MSKIWAKISEDKKIIPMNDSDYEKLGRIGFDEFYYIDIKKPRNPKFHRMFFALLNLGFQNQEKYKEFEAFRGVMIMEAGYYTRAVSSNGTELFWPKSISFESMDQMEFKSLYDSVLINICKMIGTDKEIVLMELENFM